MQKRNIIVIGASAGGFNPIRELIAGLPEDLDASIFVVWHMAPEVRGVLPQVINRNSLYEAVHASDGEPIAPNRIYVAPPDYHMVLEKGAVRVRRGPRENGFRPAIDPLFRSAAFNFGPQVIGVILSGALDDGTAGLWNVGQFGGITIAQDPREAEVPSMPENAIRSVAVDHVLRIADMPGVIASLAKENVPERPSTGPYPSNPTIKKEIDIAMDNKISKGYFSGKLTPYTCPECHGVLAAVMEGDRIRFRCHTGHAYSTDTFIAAISTSIEDSLWNAIRNIQECVMLLNQMGDHYASLNQPKLAATFFRKATEADKRQEILRRTAADHERLSSESISREARQDI